MSIPVCLVLIISRLDDQSKFQMLTLFSDRHIGEPSTPNSTKSVKVEALTSVAD